MDHRNNISVVFTVSTTTDIDVYFLSGYDIGAVSRYYVAVNGQIDDYGVIANPSRTRRTDGITDQDRHTSFAPLFRVESRLPCERDAHMHIGHIPSCLLRQS